MNEQVSLERHETQAARAGIEDALQRIGETLNGIGDHVRVIGETVNVLLRRLGEQDKRLAVIEGLAEDAAEAAADAKELARKAVYGPESPPEDEPACEVAECNGQHVPAQPLTLAERTGHSGARLYAEPATSTRLAREIQDKGGHPSNVEVRFP